MGRKLIIHIGSHKTGSTSIQHALYANRQSLRKQGIEFFCTSPGGEELSHGNAGDWIVFDYETGLGTKILGGLVEKIEQTGQNVLISAEMFYWIFDPAIINEFYKSLSLYFSEIKIIVYLRRQDLHIVSHFQEAGKNSQLPSAWFYSGSENKALPAYKDHFEYYFNYYRRISAWGDAFGDNNLIIRLFEPKRLKKEDAVEDFFDTFGFTYEHKVSRINERIGFKATKINHLMNQSGTRLYFRRIISESIKNDIIEISPSKSEAFTFYQRFREMNKKLNQKYRINQSDYLFDEDFSFYPDSAKDEWDENIANSAFVDLLNAFEKVPLSRNDEIDLIRDAAIKIESIDLEMASKLMDVALRLRPNGLGIKQKVSDYSHRLALKNSPGTKRIIYKSFSVLYLFRMFIKAIARHLFST